MKTNQVLEEIKKNKDSIEFMKTGLSRLDKELDGGLMRKELVVLGGFTGSGKSYLAAQIMYNIAQQGFKTAYFSLEISNTMLVSRLVGQLSNIRPTRLIAGLLKEEEQEKRIKAEGQLIAFNSLMDFYDDAYSLLDIQNKCRQEEHEFVVVDFIQNILSPQPDEYSRLSFAALQLQKLAKELNICILVLSQLSNQVGKIKSENSQVEYKGSGNIATVADLGLYLIKEENTAPGAIRGLSQIVCKKNRRGLSGWTLPLKIQFPGGLIEEHDQ